MDEQSQECRELISTLPANNSWSENKIHQDQGFWYSPKQIQGILYWQKHLQAQDSDIFLVTLPKSGTTWLKALMFSLLNREKYHPIIQNQNHPLVTNNPHDLVPFMELLDHNNVKNSALDSSCPRLFATHLAYVSLPNSVKESLNCKIVYLCRDPKETLISYWHFVNRYRKQNGGTIISLEEAFQLYCRGVNVNGPFWEHILGYWNESLKRPEKVMFVRFEELKIKPNHVVKEIAEFIGCPFTKEEEDQGLVDGILKMCSFEYLSNLEVNINGKVTSYEIECSSFFRCGQVGDWKNYLTVEMVDKLNTIIEMKLGEHGVRV